MQKSFIKHALATGIAGVLVIVAPPPAFARHARNHNAVKQSAVAYAYEPQIYTGSVNRQTQCLIAADYIRGYGYKGSCANPLARAPSLDPTFNPE